MTQYFFATPWATSGDTSAIPTATQPDGSVSYAQGFGPDYQAASTDPAVLYPERQKFNALMNAVTGAIQILQVHGFPDFITSAANGGTPYSYDQYAFVRYSGVVYYSLINSNTDTPPSANWAAFSAPSSFSTGMMVFLEDTVLPSGWVWANGTTIGDGSSGATGRANADCQAMFTQIWTAFPNAVRPIQDSTGAASTRGVSAAADWAAHKRLPVRDMRDVVPAGLGTMGAVSNRGLLTGYRQGVDGSVFGSTGGEESHTPITDETSSHAHAENLGPGSVHATTYGPGNGWNGMNSGTGSGAVMTDNAGAGQNFNIVQPTTICNYIIKL